jgi:hypothetical protein
MLIILEGADNSGKTTMAHALADAHQGESLILKYGMPDPPDQNPFAEYEAGLIDRMNPDPEALTIVDRWALGDIIYGPLMRGKARLNAGGLLHCEMLADGLGALRLMMNPPLAVILKRWRARGDDLIDISEAAGLHESYTYYAPRYGYRQLRDVPGEDRLMGILLTARHRAMEAEALKAVAPGYIGTLHPHAVLAGDVRSGADDPDPVFTHAFTPAGPGSAQYLMDALATHCRTAIWHAGVLNTGEEGMNLKEANALFNEPHWVALGANASQRLNEAGIDHTDIAHPQYWRRFRNKDVAEYASQIMTLGGIL